MHFSRKSHIRSITSFVLFAILCFSQNAFADTAPQYRVDDGDMALMPLKAGDKISTYRNNDPDMRFINDGDLSRFNVSTGSMISVNDGAPNLLLLKNGDKFLQLPYDPDRRSINGGSHAASGEIEVRSNQIDNDGPMLISTVSGKNSEAVSLTLVSAVPEPASYLMLLAGCIFMTVAYRGKNRPGL